MLFRSDTFGSFFLLIDRDGYRERQESRERERETERETDRERQRDRERARERRHAGNGLCQNRTHVLDAHISKLDEGQRKGVRV